MELTPGYKQTDLGVLPEDWDIKAVHQLSVVKTGPFGTLLKASEYSKGEGVPLISVGEIREGFLRITDETPLVSKAVTRRLPQYVLRRGDIVFGRKGAVDRSALIRANQDGWFLGSDGISLRPAQEYIPRYLALQFQSSRVQSWLVQHAIGTTMPSLNQEILRRAEIPVPATRAEQEAIAEALCDADALIESLEQLLDKKRQIKQGAMQELLTGKKRLPGFVKEFGWKKTEIGGLPQDWSVLPLREVISFENGKPLEQTVTTDGRYCLVTLDSIGIDGRLKSQHKRTNVSEGSLAKNDIVSVLSDLAHGDLLGLCDLIPENNRYVLNQRMGRLRLKTNASPQFIRLQINRQQRHFKNRGQGTSQRHIYRRDFDSLLIPFPECSEQEAIAQVLSDMDSEITALEGYLTKSRSTKKSMMQVLLTGRIRLI